jgi:hypothetical protein
MQNTTAHLLQVCAAWQVLVLSCCGVLIADSEDLLLTCKYTYILQIAVGAYSKSIVTLMNEFELYYKNNLRAHNRPESDIPTVIIIDRSMDFVSPLLSPLTYEAMLDEIFSIKGKTITFDPEVTGKGPTKHVRVRAMIYD